MITVTDVVFHEDLSFEEYLKLPNGFSHSYLKGERNGIAAHIEETNNMRRGTLVDKILTEPHSVDMSDPMYVEAREIAGRLQAQFGPAIKRFKKQISITAVFHHQGFSMPVRGRLDFLLPRIAVIDLKVSGVPDMKKNISHFGYDNQLWGYSKMAGVSKSYLLAYMVKNKSTEIHGIDVSTDYNEFWAEAILRFGSVKN